MKILLAEDTKDLNHAVTVLLKHEGFEVDSAYDGQQAMDMIANNGYDAVIMDIMMPKVDGITVLSNMRQKHNMTPVMLLTAKSDIDDRVAGLDAGADDYLTKPFAPKELLARLRALARRQYDVEDGKLTFGDVALEGKTMTLENSESGASVRLSEKEFRALEVLMANQGQILTREQLAVKIWGYENEAEYNNVEVYMTFVRKKLAFIGSKTVIKAVRGVGYELRSENV